jgi:sugar lactone lactonase YvrE
MKMICILIMVTASGASAPPAPVEPGQRLEARILHHLVAPETDAMHMPTDVAVDHKGAVYVADGANDRVVCFAEGKGEPEMITRAGDDRLTRPVGLTCDAEDNLWIADTGNRRIVVLGRDRKLRQLLDLPALDSDHPADPTDVAVTAEDGLYVIDNDNHRILKYGQDGQWTSLGGPGRGLGQFQWPFMACTSKDGDLFLTEVIGARAQHLLPDGRWTLAIGRWGVEPGQLYRPKGIAAGPDGNVYVSDSTLSVVQAFASQGRFLGVLTDGQGEPLRFEHPMGMCFDRQGRLYVIELRANRVAVVELPALAAATRPAEEQTDDGGEK